MQEFWDYLKEEISGLPLLGFDADTLQQYSLPQTGSMTGVRQNLGVSWGPDRHMEAHHSRPRRATSKWVGLMEHHSGGNS